MEAEIIGFSMSFANSKACYIPLLHSDHDEQIKLNEFIVVIRQICEDKSILKIGQNIKYDFII